MADANIKKKVEVHWGMRKKESLYLLDKLQDFKTKLKFFTYHIYLSQEKGHDPKFSGRLTLHLNNFIDEKATYYVCGNPSMVHDVQKHLREREIEKIHLEEFTWSLN